MTTSLDDLLATLPPSKLKEAAEALSQRYREARKPFLSEEAHYLAYLAMRFPGTFEAITAVLSHLPQDVALDSFLDLGAGPGTGYLAASRYFNTIGKATLVEADRGFIRLGQQLVPNTVSWQRATLPCSLTPHDLVLMSYSLNEMTDPDAVVQVAWEATQQFLVIIEPGTPTGYQRILQARRQLLDLGASIVAPCPHAQTCPLLAGDWCHFPARVERNKLHRYLKGGTLGFEDEKYSYLIVSRHPQPTPAARIVGPMQFKKGQVILPLCTAEGQYTIATVSQKNKSLYKACRKKSWGDGV